MAARPQLDLLAGLEGEHRGTAQHEDPLVLRLVVPARLRRGVPAALTGTPEYNAHANDIDFQIEADFIGLMAPGMPDVSNDYCVRAGTVMNAGDGILGGVFFTSYFGGRFFVEFFKEYQALEDSFLTMGQYLSIIPFLFGVGLLLYARIKRKRTCDLRPPPPPPTNGDGEPLDQPESPAQEG